MNILDLSAIVNDTKEIGDMLREVIYYMMENDDF